MIAFPDMLVSPAQEAGIPTPPYADDYNPDDYPQFHLFCCAQLGLPIRNGTSHWDNAKIIKSFEPDQCKTVTAQQLIGAGFIN